MPSPAEIQLTPEEGESIPDHLWRLVDQNEDFRTWEADVTLPSGIPGTVRKREYLDSADLLAFNAELRKENSARRYTAGMGSDKGGNMPMVHTGSIPLNVYYDPVNGIAKRQAEGDRDHLRWWLRRPENEPFRVRDGGLRK